MTTLSPMLPSRALPTHHPLYNRFVWELPVILSKEHRPKVHPSCCVIKIPRCCDYIIPSGSCSFASSVLPRLNPVTFAWLTNKTTPFLSSHLAIAVHSSISHTHAYSTTYGFPHRGKDTSYTSHCTSNISMVMCMPIESLIWNNDI